MDKETFRKVVGELRGRNIREIVCLSITDYRKKKGFLKGLWKTFELLDAKVIEVRVLSPYNLMIDILNQAFRRNIFNEMYFCQEFELSDDTTEEEIYKAVNERLQSHLEVAKKMVA